MSVIVVGSPAWVKLEKEVREGKLTKEQLDKRLAGAAPNVPGVSAPQGSTAPPPKQAGKNALIEGAKTGLSAIPGIGPFFQAGQNLVHAGEAVGGATGSALESAGNLGGGAGVAGLAGSAIGEGIINWVKPEATKITLYGVLIFGAVAMMVFGLAELLKPVGGPSLTTIGSRAAKVAAIA